MTDQPDKTSAPDGDRQTLHIRCGSDIRQALRDAGFIGDFLEYSNPYCQGPVPDSPDLQAIRARFITEAYGGVLGLSETDVAEKLRLDRLDNVANITFEWVVTVERQQLRPHYREGFGDVPLNLRWQAEAGASAEGGADGPALGTQIVQ